MFGATTVTAAVSPQDPPDQQPQQKQQKQAKQEAQERVNPHRSYETVQVWTPPASVPVSTLAAARVKGERMLKIAELGHDAAQSLHITHRLNRKHHWRSLCLYVGLSDPDLGIVLGPIPCTACRQHAEKALAICIHVSERLTFVLIFVFISTIKNIYNTQYCASILQCSLVCLVCRSGIHGYVFGVFARTCHAQDIARHARLRNQAYHTVQREVAELTQSNGIDFCCLRLLVLIFLFIV